MPIRLIVALAALLLATPILAQEWPRRSVTFVVPAAPGSSADTAARALAERL